MPTLNKIKYTFGQINIRYHYDAYDVFTEGIRSLVGEVPNVFYIKCFKCDKKAKISKKLFGPANFVISCDCENSCLVSCFKADKDYFHISI